MKKITKLLETYQHVSNGGISIDLEHVISDYSIEDKVAQLTGLQLRIKLSSMGVPMEVTFPIFKPAAAVFRDLYEIIEAHPVPSAYGYLNEPYAQITDELGTEVYYRTDATTGKVKAVEQSDLFGGSGPCGSEEANDLAVEEDNQESLEDLMVRHAISLRVSPEGSWEASVHDHESPEPTRQAWAWTPRAAVETALALSAPSEEDVYGKDE